MQRRHLIWLAAALALAALGVVVLTLKPAKEQPRVTFQAANGNVLTFLGVTYGRTNTMAFGKPYQQMLYKLLPARFKKWSGARTQTFTVSDTNNPSFWVHESQAVPMFRPGAVSSFGSSASSSSGTSFGGGGGFGSGGFGSGGSGSGGSGSGGGFGGGFMPMGFLGLSQQPRILDEYGCEFAPTGTSTSSSSSSGERLSLIYLSSDFPQGRMAALCLYDSDGTNQRSVKFMVPGVDLVVLPEPSQPLPAAKQVGELSVQLVRFITGLKSGPNISVATNGAPHSQAEFRITRKGVPMVIWQPNDVWITDARGRSVSTGTWMAGRRGSNVVVNFSTILDPTAGPFSVQARFVHDWLPAPEEMVGFTNLPLPQSGETLQPGMVAEAGTGRVTLKTAYGEESVRPVESGVMDGRSVFETVISQPSPELELRLVEATAGTDRSRIPSHSWRRTGDDKYYFSLDPPAGAQTVDLTFGLYQRVAAVEFEATPEVFKPLSK